MLWIFCHWLNCVWCAVVMREYSECSLACLCMCMYVYIGCRCFWIFDARFCFLCTFLIIFSLFSFHFWRIEFSQNKRTKKNEEIFVSAYLSTIIKALVPIYFFFFCIRPRSREACPISSRKFFHKISPMDKIFNLAVLYGFLFSSGNCVNGIWCK